MKNYTVESVPLDLSADICEGFWQDVERLVQSPTAPTYPQAAKTIIAKMRPKTEEKP